MLIGRVKGNVVSTNKIPELSEFKLLIVVPINLETLEDAGEAVIAVDNVDAGEGDIVMCVGGSSSRQDPRLRYSPADVAVHAVIDSIDVRGKRTFEKFGATDPSRKG